MKEKPKQEESPPAGASAKKNSLRTFAIFCALVLLVILGSLGYRAFRIWQQSTFDGVSGYSILFVERDGKKAAIYTFDPPERRVMKAVFQAKTTLPNVTKAFGIPVDGELRVGSIDDSDTFPLALANYSLYNQTKEKQITIIDLLRLRYLYGIYPATKKETTVVSLPEEIDTYEDTLDGYFIDSKLEYDKKTITIVNGTSVSGLGSRLENLVSKTGATVISITTAHDPIQTTKIIYYGDRSYTVDRLARLLGFPTEQRNEAALSDILIEIGEDSQRTDKF